MSAHDDEYLLGAHALDRLDQGETRKAQEHLDDCGGCRTEFEQLVDARQCLGRIPSGWLAQGPPLGGTVLEAALRNIRANKAAARARSRRALMLAASLAGLAGTFSSGLLLGYRIKQEPNAQPQLAGVREAKAVDPAGKISLSVTVTPASGWVRLRATVTGVPAGQNCRLLVVRRDGTREVAGGWIGSARGETEAVAIDGSAAVPADDVDAIVVADTAGKTLVMLKF